MANVQHAMNMISTQCSNVGSVANPMHQQQYAQQPIANQIGQMKPVVTTGGMMAGYGGNQGVVVTFMTPEQLEAGKAKFGALLYQVENRLNSGGCLGFTANAMYFFEGLLILETKTQSGPCMPVMFERTCIPKYALKDVQFSRRPLKRRKKLAVWLMMLAGLALAMYPWFYARRGRGDGFQLVPGTAMFVLGLAYMIFMMCRSKYWVDITYTQKGTNMWGNEKTYDVCKEIQLSYCPDLQKITDYVYGPIAGKDAPIYHRAAFLIRGGLAKQAKIEIDVQK